MPNFASNRLTLTGPSDEIARFMRECIRVQRADPDNSLSLDLDAIVPMPPEILATCDGATDELRALARTATGFEGWYDWRRAHWGTKWPTCDFHGRLIADNVYDCSFTTAWSCPIPALCALAVAYPLLRGAVAASEPDEEWSLAAAFRDGAFVWAKGPYDPQMQLLVRGGYLPDPLASSSIEALLAITDDQTLLNAPDAVDQVWMRAFRAVEHMGRLVGGDLPMRLTFERITLGVCGRLDSGSKQDFLDSGLAREPGCEGHVEFLLAHDRARTAIDRDLLKTLAGCLRGDAMWGGGDGGNYVDEIEMEILDCIDDDDLRDWACLAMFRPGAMLDFADEDALRAGFLTYADQLRIDMMAHLRGTAGDGRSSIAA